jgi:hypothetical protein
MKVGSKLPRPRPEGRDQVRNCSALHPSASCARAASGHAAAAPPSSVMNSRRYFYLRAAESMSPSRRSRRVLSAPLS